MKDKVFKLFSDCVPVKGARRSIIYDLGRKSYQFIPNMLFEILMKFNGNSIQDVKRCFPENVTHIDSYFKFLEENEYVFFCDKSEVHFFPPLDLYWDYPGDITTTIFKIFKECKIDFNKVISELFSLKCKDYLIHFNCDTEIKDVVFFLEIFKEYTIRNIDFYIPYSVEIDDIEVLTRLCDDFITINKIVIYKSPINRYIESKSKVKGKIIYSNQQEIDYHSISTTNFIVNIPFFTEAQNHNVFFNRKAIISSLGFLSNSVFDDSQIWEISRAASLKSVIKNNEYTESWFIRKDSILVCKDCEFRYMCVDARNPIKVRDDLYTFSSELECPYNPFIAKWKGQEEWVSTNDYLHANHNNAR